LLTILIFLQLLSYGQSTTYHSWDGNGIIPNSKLMILNIFVNVIYDEHPDTNKVDTTFWPEVTDTLKEGVNVTGTLPTYLLDFMDTVYVPGQTHGCMTRLYGESSFDSLQITGDFIVVNVRESYILDNYPQFKFNYIARAAVDVINEHGFSTVYGHNAIEYYDYEHQNQFYYIQFLIRNISKSYGNLGQGSGYNNYSLGSVHLNVNNTSYNFSGKGTLQNIGGYDISKNPTSIVTHEISHSLFGGNNFHTSGGNHRGSTETMPWMNIQGGYGLMGAAGSGLVSCNGYERWRMHWKHPASPYYISARNVLDNGFFYSDISKENGNKWFILRDFVTYGDAIRIKLPYKDSTITPNQYIWLEFHDVGNNDKLDFLQFTKDDTCLHQASSGIYAYYQIGRDVLEGSQVWDIINRDNLRIISNEGYWDYVQYPLPYDTDFVCTQWNWEKEYYVPEYSNAFCGYQDQETFIVPKWYDPDLGNTCDTIGTELQYKIREYTPRNMIKNGDTITHNIMFNGDAFDAFSVHRKLNMGTNPSTCNAKTCYTSNNVAQTNLTFEANSQYNNTTTYLTGLSIEMIPMSNGSRWLVKIRWDDYDIVNDARWTGKIVLKGTEQVNLTRGHSITLAQNRTPAKQMRNTESGYFADPTQLTCEAGSHFTQQPQSSLILTEKSRFVLDSGATYHLGDSAQILVQEKSSFYINRGADFIGGIASKIIVDSLSTLYVYDTAKLRREARIIVRPGGALIVNGGTLTSACDGEMWEGIIVEGDSTQRQIASKQGSVLLYNATIENARDAISTRGADEATQWDKTGGIVQATNTLFRNNMSTAEFFLYENHTSNNTVSNNVSHFTRCTFTIDDDNLFANNDATFGAHVTLYKVRGVKFNGCAFRNEVTTTTDTARGSAVRTITAGFTAKRVCPQVSNIDPCGCLPSFTDTITRCSFTGFYEAVHAANTNGNYDITLDNCDFRQNQTGVELAAANNAQVSFCDFDLSDSVSYCGVNLANSTGYTVESNTFHWDSYTSAPYPTGVVVSNSGTAENVIRKNVFHNLKYGCFISGMNGTINIKPANGLQFECNIFNGCSYDINLYAGNIRNPQGMTSAGADNKFTNTINSSFLLTSASPFTYWHSNSVYHMPYNPSTTVTVKGNASANNCLSSLCWTGLPPTPPPGPRGEWLAQYRMMAEELRALSDTIGNRPDDSQDAETAALQMQLSDLSAAMGDLARTAIRAILSDTVVDMTLLKEWYGTIVETMCTSSLQQEQNTSIPVEAYLLAEVYSTEGDYAAADALLASLPQRFSPDEPSRNEYGNYLNLQRLRENVAGNWYRQAEAEIADLQQVAEYDNGRAARMAKEILCFFHHICYEDEPLFDLDGIGERAIHGDGVRPTANADGLHLHPNPANTTLTVESDSPVRTITIYDLTGKTMLTVENCPLPATVNVVSLPRGIYLLRAVTDEGVKTARFVKN